MIVAQNRLLYYGAAATTAIAGILHLLLATNEFGDDDIFEGIFFIVTGIAQIFWVVPMVRKWGLPWYLVGIGGTIVLIAIWSITRIPNNPIIGEAEEVDVIGIATEALQVAFIGLTAAIVAYETRRKRLDKKTAGESA
jgi:hypothetical protein